MEKNSNAQNYKERNWEVHTHSKTCHFGPCSSKKDTFELKVTEKKNGIQRLGRASVQ